MEIYWKKIKKPLKKKQAFQLVDNPILCTRHPHPLSTGGGVEPLEGGCWGIAIFRQKIS